MKRLKVRKRHNRLYRQSIKRLRVVLCIVNYKDGEKVIWQNLYSQKSKTEHIRRFKEMYYGGSRF